MEPDDDRDEANQHHSYTKHIPPIYINIKQTVNSDLVSINV